MRFGEGHHLGRLASVASGQVFLAAGVFDVPHDLGLHPGFGAGATEAQPFGRAGSPLASEGLDHHIHRVFGHLPVGGELAPGDGHHAVGRDLDAVAAREVGRSFTRGRLAGRRRQKGPESGPDTGDVGPGDLLRGDGVGGIEDVVDVFGQAGRIVKWAVVGGVGGAEVDLVTPGDDEDRPLVLSDRDDCCNVARERTLGHRDVDALGRTDRVRVLAFVEGSDLVGPDATGVHDGGGADLEGLTTLGHDGDPADLPVGSGGDPGGGRVVRRHRIVLEDGGAQHRKREAGIVAPGIPVEESGHQSLGVQGGQMGQRFGGGDLLVSLADPDAPGQVVEPEGGQVDPGHAAVDHTVLAEQGDQEGKGGHQMGGVLQQSLAFGQVLVHQAVLPLAQVAQPAMDEFGGLGRRPRRKVVLLDQRRAESTTGGVKGDARSGDATADDHHVEGLRGQTGEAGGAVKAVRLRCATAPAGVRCWVVAWVPTDVSFHPSSLPQTGPLSARRWHGPKLCAGNRSACRVPMTREPLPWRLHW